MAWLLARPPGFQRAGTGLLCALVFFGSAWLYRYYDERALAAAVVTTQKAEVRSGPGQNFRVGFTIPEGRRVLVLDETAHADWAEIGVYGEGLKGWVPRSSIERI